MKRFLVSFFFLSCFFTGICQTDSSFHPYKGGQQQLSKALVGQLHYPDSLYEKGKSGVVMTLLYINGKGQIDSITSAFPSDPLFFQEAKRALALTSGNWKAHEASYAVLLPLYFLYMGDAFPELTLRLDYPFLYRQQTQPALPCLFLPPYFVAITSRSR